MPRSAAANYTLNADKTITVDNSGCMGSSAMTVPRCLPVQNENPKGPRSGAIGQAKVVGPGKLEVVRATLPPVLLVLSYKLYPVMVACCQMPDSTSPRQTFFADIYGPYWIIGLIGEGDYRCGRNCVVHHAIVSSPVIRQV